MKKLPEKIITYSLSLEELALALGMINSPDTGKILLQSVYPQIGAQEMEARLTSASHSLLARGLCTMSVEKMPILDKGLEMAVFPLVMFDALLQINLVGNQTSWDSRVHIQLDKRFSSHHFSNEVIHAIDYGSYDDLPAYVESLFDGFSDDSEKSRLVGKLTITILDQAYVEHHSFADTERALMENSWSEMDAKALSQDLADQTVRGILSRIFTRPNMTLSEINTTPKKMLLFLKGLKRNWLFEFAPENAGAGDAWLVDQASFEKAFSAFLNK